MQEDYWEKGTQSRKSKEQWFNVNVDILMKRMRHNESAIDGENFLSFDDKESQWVAPVDAALPTKRKWDDVPILNQYTKGYLEKECVDWLNKFREYGDEVLKKGSPPKVYVFANRSSKNKTKLQLTCLATGFYPKDVMLTIRKYRTSLPADEIESTGIRPNHDGTFQLRNSVIIEEDEKAEYDCSVFHRTLEGQITVRWDGKCIDCYKGSTPAILVGVVIGAVIGVVIAILLVAALLYLYNAKRLVIPWSNTSGAAQSDHANGVAQNLLPGDNYSNGHAQTAANGGKQLIVQGRIIAMDIHKQQPMELFVQLKKAVKWKPTSNCKIVKQEK
ncbi:hypothetical protein cypCar_00014722 [Cyprinus carpio]|nr:hypothetical protein cypCar_00014722 [Cyprinus carpio]